MAAAVQRGRRWAGRGCTRARGTELTTEHATPSRAYFICATPRTGSTHLCSLLASTGVAGRPESYFREQDLGRWASRWEIPGPGSSPDWFRGYVRAAVTAGRAGGPVFGARVMWGSMEGIVDGLQPTERGRSSDARRVLQHWFGPVRFVWLRRLDAVAQAVSRHRAERSNVWHVTEERASIAEPDAEVFDFDAIHAFVTESNDHNREWAAWFERQRVKPLEVSYEDLTRDADLQVDRILSFLEIDRSQERPARSANRRMADERSAEWADRYRTELRRRG